MIIRWASHMNLDLFYAFTFVFVGATLFMLVDEYERDGLVLVVAGRRGDRAQIAADVRC